MPANDNGAKLLSSTEIQSRSKTQIKVMLIDNINNLSKNRYALLQVKIPVYALL